MTEAMAGGTVRTANNVTEWALAYVARLSLALSALITTLSYCTHVLMSERDREGKCELSL